HFGRFILTLLAALLFAVPGVALGRKAPPAPAPAAALSAMALPCGHACMVPASAQSPEQALRNKSSDQIACARRRRRRRIGPAIGVRTSLKSAELIHPCSRDGKQSCLRQVSTSGRSPPRFNLFLL